MGRPFFIWLEVLIRCLTTPLYLLHLLLLPFSVMIVPLAVSVVQLRSELHPSHSPDSLNSRFFPEAKCFQLMFLHEMPNHSIKEDHLPDQVSHIQLLDNLLAGINELLCLPLPFPFPSETGIKDPLKGHN